MYNRTTGNNSKLASSIQRDYQQAARQHRLIKASGYEGNRFNPSTVGLTIVSVATIAIALMQVISI